jgi:transcriptional regulator with XRE-family HTH domain
VKSHKEFKPILLALGERIRKQRITNDFAPKQVAAKVYLTAEAYLNIEKGMSDSSITTFLLICEALDIKFNKLIEGLAIDFEWC